MIIAHLEKVFFWSSIVNLTLYLVGFFVYLTARNWIYRMHGKWFRLQEEQIDRIYYSSLQIYKILILVFNVVPYLVLRIVF